jgi:putative pyrroloquinoline-quinone binding quinoprotein
MQKAVKRLGILFGSFLLVACGGGGGGGGGSSSTPALLTFVPSTVAETVGASDTIKFSVVATPTAAIAEMVYVQIVDEVGVITTDVTVTANSNGTYTAAFNISPNLAAGQHTGNIKVKLCRDQQCSSQIAGSPALLPYNINVLSASNLTPLSTLANVDDWQMFQANAAHTGYVPATLNASNFSTRWRWHDPNGNTITTLVSANGNVYFSNDCAISTTFCKNNNTKNVYALAENDASEFWHINFNASLGNVGHTNPPAFGGNKVFIAATIDGGPYLTALDASNGAVLDQQIYQPTGTSYLAPTLDSGAVYVPTNTVSSFPINGGPAIWSTAGNNVNFPYGGNWTPAVDANYVYTFSTLAGLAVIDKASGAILNNIHESGTYNHASDSVQGAPIIGSNDTVFTVSELLGFGDQRENRIGNFHTASPYGENWVKTGAFATQPALANDVLYVASLVPLQLQARSAATGDIVWSWAPPAGETDFYGNVVATDNIVFVSTTKKVYAISLSTHQSVWDYWRAGNLAVSKNGVLYISTTDDGFKSDTGITAVNLH